MEKKRSERDLLHERVSSKYEAKTLIALHVSNDAFRNWNRCMFSEGNVFFIDLKNVMLMTQFPVKNLLKYHKK